MIFQGQKNCAHSKSVVELVFVAICQSNAGLLVLIKSDFFLYASCCSISKDMVKNAKEILLKIRSKENMLSIQGDSVGTEATK